MGSTYGNWLYNLNLDNTITITGYIDSTNLGKDNPNYTLVVPSAIPDGGEVDIEVASIGNGAFSNYKYIKSVSLPKSIQTLGVSCFSNCSSLSTINLSNVVNIGISAFTQCIKLKNIYLTSIQTLGERCFYNCISLNNITFSNQIANIPETSFYGCTNVEVLTIPDSVTNIGESCFFSCSKLTSLILGESITTIGATAFHSCALTELFIPPQLEISNIANGAFLNQGDNFSVTMPSEYIKNPINFDNKFPENSWSPYYIFDTSGSDITLTQNTVTQTAYNYGITTSQLDAIPNIQIQESIVYISSGVKTIEPNAFESVGYMNTIYIGKNVETIGESAFSNLEYLEHIYVSQDIKSVFNSSLATIENNSFSSCKKLKELVIPTSVISIGTSSFENCIGLSDVISYSGSKLETIGESAFQNCNNLIIVRLPNSLKTINKHAFDGCNGLVNILLPDTVETIDDYAFQHCMLLENITISKNIKTIGTMAFHNCRQLSMIKNIPYSFKNNLSGIFSMTESQNYWEYHKLYVYWRGQLELTKSLTSSAKAILASNMGAYNQIEHQMGYFSSNGPLVYTKEGVLKYRSARAWIPSSEIWYESAARSAYPMSATSWSSTWLDGYAQHVTPYTKSMNNYYTIMNAQNNGPTKLIPATYIYRVDISSTTETTLTKTMVSKILGVVDPDIIFSVTIVDSDENIIDTIGEDAFQEYANNINAIVFSNKITDINTGAFQGCISLKGKITFPESLITIGNSAFQDCINITNVYLPKSIATINEKAFYGTGLTTVSFFNYALNIGIGAFVSCPNLVNVCGPTTLILYIEGNNSTGSYINTTTQSSGINIINYLVRIYFTPDSSNNITKETVSAQCDYGTPFIAYIDDIIDSSNPINISEDAFIGSLITKLFIIGNTPKNIGNGAFKNCSNLTYVSLSDSVQSIGLDAFSNCSSLISVTIPSRLHTVCNSDYFSYTNSTPNTKVMYHYFSKLSSTNNDGILTNYDVNSQIETSNDFKQPVVIMFDNSVNIIENNAFNGNENIVSLVIPQNVSVIGEYAFANCPNLSSVVCSEDSNLVFIYDYAFYNCTNLSTVTLPMSLEIIGIGAFISCNNLWNVTIPYLFNCDSLTQTTIYFETANMTGESWSSNSPSEAGGTFFTFNFEHANGLYTTYSYAKDKYIQSKWNAYQKEEDAKHKRDEIWNSIGFAALSIVIVVATMTGVGIIADAFIAEDAGALLAEEGSIYGESAIEGADVEEGGESEFEYNHPGRQMARARKLKAYQSGMFKRSITALAIDKTFSYFAPINTGLTIQNPFQFNPTQQQMYGTSTSVYTTSTTGSWIITTIINTNRNDINIYNLEHEVTTSILSDLNAKYSPSKKGTTIKILHESPFKYIITTNIEDANYNLITDNDKLIVNNKLDLLLRPYANQYYLEDVVLSNICFSKNTPILTDQGIVNIEDINTTLHSIRNKPILHITKSVSSFKHLVCFEKDSMGKNYPSNRTVVSQKHNIYHGGKLIPAIELLDKYSNVQLVPYHGEILYNILMKTHDKVVINNMICETLHPDNIVAKIYNIGNQDERSQIFVLLKNHIKNKDYEKYMKIVNKITKNVPNTIINDRKGNSLKLMYFQK
jgi:hypothetical protein